MAALTAASWTVTITERWQGNRKKRAIGTLALPGTDTYPDGGIPLPPIGAFGFVRSLDVLDIVGVNAAAGTVADYAYKLDKANNKLFLYGDRGTAAAGLPLAEATTAEVPGPRTLDFHAIGW